MGEHLAAIDIGTNSIHLVVARVAEGSRFEVIAQEKEVVRLGTSSGDMKHLAPDAMDRGISALERFGRIAAISDAEIFAVATSAVREAENADEFVDRARVEAGIEVEVISGVEEARLIHLGVLQAVPVYDRRLVVVDVGGGSTEVLVGERGEVLAAGSLKLGAIRLTQRFFRSERLHPGAVGACRRHVRAALVPVVRDVQRLGFDVAVGCSGTISMVAALAQARRGDPAPRSLNRFTFEAAEVEAVVTDLAAADTIDARRRLPGMDPGRADIALAGAVIVEQVMAELGITAMTVSGYALREGALLDALARRRGGTLHHLQDLRRRSVLHLMGLMDDDPAHAHQVAALALELFDGTAAHHGLDASARELLEAAALLANVGLFVAHSGHHKHSYYVIRSSDHLLGFTDHEIELIALAARYHRKSTPKAKHAEFARLRPEDQALVRTLAGILRVAIGLDRTHAGLVRSVTVSSSEEGAPVVVEVASDPDADLSLELYAAEERSGLLGDVLGRPVQVVAATAEPAAS